MVSDNFVVLHQLNHLTFIVLRTLQGFKSLPFVSKLDNIQISHFITKNLLYVILLDFNYANIILRYSKFIHFHVSSLFLNDTV